MTDPSYIAGKISRITGKKIIAQEDWMAVEEPLEIRLGRSPIAITMRTPGHDHELAAGFLLTEGIIQSAEDILRISGPRRSLANVVSVKLRSGLKFDRDRLSRYFHTTSSCGLCGKTTLQAIAVRTRALTNIVRIPLQVLYSLPEKLRREQEVFEETGGLHAAAIFDPQGQLFLVGEDIGRHNAVDKVIGGALLQKLLPLDHCILMVSGRAGFEIVQKALVARIPIVAAVSAPSSLAIALARKFKMTLVGFLRGESCNVYAGAERIDS